MELHEYEDWPTGPAVALRPHNEEDVFCDAPTASSLPVGYKPYNQLDYFKKIIRAYQGRDEDAVKYVKKVKAFIDKPLDGPCGSRVVKVPQGSCSMERPHELELGHIRLAMKKVKRPRKLDISVFYRLTRRLLHEDLNYDDERLLIHFYDTFYNENIKLLGKVVSMF